MKTKRFISIVLAMLMMIPIISLAGITASAASPTWKLNAVSNLTEADAKISSRVTFSGKITLTEGGFYLGTSESNMHKNAYPDKATIKSSFIDSSFLMSKYKEALKPGTKYYYKIYVIASGKTYTSPVGSFTTKPTDSAKWTLNTVTNISATDAKISSKVTFSSTRTLTEGGFYLGTSESSMHKNAYPDKNCNIKSSYFNSSFLMSKYKEVLTAGQKYYYKIYVVVNGTTYTSGIGSFTTSGNSTGKFTLTYNANGGSGAPAAQSGGNTYTISSTIPTRSGYTFIGWSLRSDAEESEYGVGAKITIGANTTLYAVWSHDNSRLQSSEIYSFSNGYSNFHADRYHITDSDFNKLTSYVEKLYGKDGASGIVSNLKTARNRKWGGSCYGMATTTILDKTGQIAFNENFDPSANTMHDVSSPKTRETTVESAINYYQIAQNISSLRVPYVEKSDANWTAYLRNLVSAAQTKDMVLFLYWFIEGGEEYGHAIVIKGYRQNSDGSHVLIAYDNRFPSRDTKVNVDKNFKTCVVDGDGKETAIAVEFLTDFMRFDYVDIDGPNNDFSNMDVTVADDNNTLNTTLQIKIEGEMTIENAESETLTISPEGEIGGTLPVFSKSMMVTSDEEGNPSTPYLLLETADSRYFNFFTKSQNYDISVCSAVSFSSVNAKGAASVTVTESEGTFVLGEGDIQYDIVMHSPISYEEIDTIGFCGTSKDGVKITYYHEEKTGFDGLNIVGKQAVPLQLTVYGEENTEYTLDNKNDDILICTHGTADGNIDARISMRGTESYDVSLLHSTGITIADMNLQYRQSATPSISVPTGDAILESVTFTSSNDNVKINSDGTLYGAKRGNAIVTCVAKCNGVTQETSFSVTVKYTWWQWLIVIFLFGWIWY